jgi:hypothetical protein
MVLPPSTFLLAIPFQPTTTIFTIVKLKQKNYRQEHDQQHGLKSCHLFFLWCKGYLLCFGNEGIERQL